jgi:hypothetical protein
MARRASRSDESRTEVVTIRLTKAERARLEQRASAAGLTVSAFAAQSLSTGRVTVEVTPSSALHPSLVAELKRIGNNVNQIATVLNAGRYAPIRNIVVQMRDLLHTLVRDEVLAARIEAMGSPEGPPHGPAHP